MTSSLPAFTIEVTAAATTNRAPTISGSPNTAINVGTNYSFGPTASDPDGDTLTFSIQNKPAWAWFNQTSGQMGGSPSNAGTHSNIVIAVTDGQLTTSMAAFNIEVTPAAPTNRAPTISGSPGTTVKVGDNYFFRPTAADPDGDALTFSIQNKPAWAWFNQSNGATGGTPAEANVGSYDNIRITVSDGTLSASLLQFSIDVSAIATGSVTLSWTPPTQNTDGSTLSDLAGYVIYYGLSATNMPNKIPLNNPGLATYVVNGLTPNTYSFAITAKNDAGIESDKSNIAVKTVN
jgi:hypothetical protein